MNERNNQQGPVHAAKPDHLFSEGRLVLAAWSESALEQQVGDDQQEKPFHNQVALVLYECGWVPAATRGHQGPAFNGGAMERRQVW